MKASLFVRRSAVAVLALAAAWLPNRVAAEQVVPVSSSGALQQALNTVPEGGVIELAAGSYSAPGGGWTIYPQGVASEARSFTIRAASGAAVTLTGGGANKILTLTTSKLITFERLTFANGLSTEQFHAGGVSLASAQAIFVSCTFNGNTANSSGTGGGAAWLDTSAVSFDSCIFNGNKTQAFGAGMSAYHSRVFVRNCQFLGNRSNMPGHDAFSTGGAIHGDASTIDIRNSRFDNNQAGYVGGAIYVIGPWQDPVTTPRMDLLVTDCTFNNNVALKDPSGAAINAPTTGGAIMMEDQTRARIYNSRFNDNSAKQGGALSSYRTSTEVQNCTFKGNQATGTSDPDGYGVAIVVLSDDNADASTNRGAINRPSARLSVIDSLIQGNGGQGNADARQGGGIFVAGDLHSAFGIGVQKNGTLESNRAVVTLKRVAFTNLATSDSGNGTGGAFTGDFANVQMDDCVISNCRTSHNGGAADFARYCIATVKNTTFASNRSANIGGGVASFGGDINLDGCSFFDNTAVGEGGYGTAIITVDYENRTGTPAVDVTGTVQNCVFSSNNGLFAIYDGHNPGSFLNRVQYSNNRFFENLAPLYTDDGGPQTALQLNLLNTNGVSKSSGGNTSLASAPALGAILMLPPRILLGAAPGETTPLASQLAHASSGGGASVDGAGQNEKSGLIATTSNAAHTLAVGGSQFKTVPSPGAAVNISTRLSVGGGDDVLIGGFIVVGSAPKRVIIRAIGPSSGVAGSLQDPTLQLVDSATGATLATNDNWRSTVVAGVITAPQAVDISATGIAPANAAESAIVATLNPGSYTAVVRGANNGTGVGLIEVYDLDTVQTSTLGNVSTRGPVQTDDNVMIGGFIYLGGPGASNVVVRAIGPTLKDSGIANSLSDPTLELVDGNGNVVQSNDNWVDSAQAATIRANGLQPKSDNESVIYATALPFGGYTAVVRGKNRGVGVGLVEAYIFD